MERYAGIYIDRGMTARLKKAHARRRKKGQRPREDPTTVSVRDVYMGDLVGGKFYVRSSNLPQVPLTGKWSSGAQRCIETRMRDGDGGAKGRVLWGWVRTTLGGDEGAVSALCYHLAPGGRVEIKYLLASGDLTDHRAMMFEALTIVAERIGLTTSNGRPTHVVYDISRKDARWYREQMGFREFEKSAAQSRVILCRDVDPKDHVMAEKRG